MKTLINPPKFASDAEESEWWYANRELVNQELIEAFDSGRMKRAALDVDSILLDPADVPRAKAAAAKNGMEYQSYIRALVHKALESEAGVA